MLVIGYICSGGVLVCAGVMMGSRNLLYIIYIYIFNLIVIKCYQPQHYTIVAPQMNSKMCTIPQKAYSNKNNFVLWVCLFCGCPPNCPRRASLSTCARAGGSCFCLSAWRSTETQSCVPPRSFQALGAWKDWKK